MNTNCENITPAEENAQQAVEVFNIERAESLRDVEMVRRYSSTASLNHIPDIVVDNRGSVDSLKELKEVDNTTPKDNDEIELPDITIPPPNLSNPTDFNLKDLATQPKTVQNLRRRLWCCAAIIVVLSLLCVGLGIAAIIPRDEAVVNSIVVSGPSFMPVNVTEDESDVKSVPVYTTMNGTVLNSTALNATAMNATAMNSTMNGTRTNMTRIDPNNICGCRNITGVICRCVNSTNSTKANATRLNSTNGTINRLNLTYKPINQTNTNATKNTTTTPMLTSTAPNTKNAPTSGAINQTQEQVRIPWFKRMFSGVKRFFGFK